MEFGRITSEELEKVDFKLPPDRQETTQLLKSNASKKKPEIFVGCAKWGRKDWVGKIYPKGTKEADFLKHYASHFNCIELNATFYRMPTVAQTQGWAGKVTENFKFCPKFTDQITHMKRLKDVKELTDRFLEGISGFKDNLGPIFLMPHPGMAPKTQDTIEAFIQSLPKDIELFVEFRHAEWFSNETAFQAAFNMLEKNKAGAIITDASGRRDCVHMRLTTPTAFIRFVGNGLHPSDYTRIDDWVQRIKSWMEQGIEQVYFFMHQHEELHSPELSKYLIQQLNNHCGLSIPEPKFVEQEMELFGTAAEPPKKRAPRKKAS
ncbi:DUF72 domain-containing protein [Ohtaekwangia koreensis]|uniref:Uncharacterized conserved protein YecE, DUF72 family n=1 Tax=Ohtaekwangia koreensis TaxID=688867 RepID=A0A1T5JNG3_9BACT|nr:DUF72 domain-containing protein [Ohtaekwangia koreensis]SKC52778.1 Uncharacterized conserved protein YecE, DUF72 family [Ohtaekwangia koreensis]